MRRSLERLARMDLSELLWRSRTSSRIAWENVAASIVRPRWERRDLLRALSRDPDLALAREFATAGRWFDTQRALLDVVLTDRQRFFIAPSGRTAVVECICRHNPDAPTHAAQRADRILQGEFDLLGYRGLQFDSAPPAAKRDTGSPNSEVAFRDIDWHYDPVHDRRAPRKFWARVPYLDAACGDHKIIWELNRHQYWLQLGRAFWLTDDSRYREALLGHLASWLDANPPLTGINWSSMLELGLRSISWIWALNFAARHTESDQPWLIDLLVGLDRQLRQVERHLSHYFSPNTHLLGEALGLYVAGLTLPILGSSRRWADVGRRVLLFEASRQISTDGGHLERSTHYHRYTLDFYLFALIVARINDDPAAESFHSTVSRLASAAQLLADDCGRLPHIGDDDGGAALQMTGRPVDDVSDSLATASVLLGRPELRIGGIPEETMWLLAHPRFSDALDAAAKARSAEPPRSAALCETGYYVSRSPGRHHLVFDAGPHGYQNAGHAHADALSLTMSLGGIPFLVDPGTGCYTIDVQMRDRFRSTAMHNTVGIDERPSSAPLGPFHWKTAAQGRIHRWRTHRAFDYIDASHNGYAPLEHRRRVVIVPGDLLIVVDQLIGEGTHHVDVHWHLDQAWRIEKAPYSLAFRTGRQYAELATLNGNVDTLRGGDESGLGWNAPVYGRLEPCTTLRIRQTGAAPLWAISVFGFDPSNVIRQIATVPVWASAGLLTSSLALRIERNATLELFTIVEYAPAASTPSSALSAGTTWRAGILESDCHMLLCRMGHDGRIVWVSLVDGSRVQASSGGRLPVNLPERSAAFHVNLDADEDLEPAGAVEDQTHCGRLDADGAY